MKLSSFLHFAGFGVKTILFRKKEPILGTVIVTDKCNLKCKHCSVNNITAVVHPYDKVRKEMQTLYDLGVRILFFCGVRHIWGHPGHSGYPSPRCFPPCLARHPYIYRGVITG